MQAYSSSPSASARLYTTLSLSTPNSIRLLTIHRKDSTGNSNSGPTNSTSPLECSLNNVDLVSKPDYLALSYTCGPPWSIPGTSSWNDENPDPEPPKEVSCNGVVMPVYANLYDGLQQLRKRGLFGPIWVDALCIRQDDLAEKASQVQMMGQIYTEAMQVIVWLGEEKKEFEDVVWATTTFLGRLEQVAKEKGPDWMMKTSFTAALVDYLGVGHDLLKRLAGVVRFHRDNRWFSRAWTYQEVCLARSVRVICGDGELEWARVVKFSEVFRANLWFWPAMQAARQGDAVPRKADGASCPYAHQREGIRNLRLMESCQERSNAQLGRLAGMFGRTDAETLAFAWFFWTLNLTRGLECSDKRDNIYASLGVGSLLSGSPIGNYLVPDYRKPINQVYVEAAKLILMKTSSLSLLSFVTAGGPAFIKNMPSWVPDFTQRSTAKPIPEFKGYRFFDASRSRSDPDCVCQITEHFSLRLSGIQFDEVDHLCRLTENEWNVSRRIQAVLELCCKLPQHSNGISRVETLWRTMICDFYQDQHPVNITLGSQFRAYMLLKLNEALYTLTEGTEATRTSIWSSLKFLEDTDGLPAIAELEVLASLKDVVDNSAEQAKQVNIYLQHLSSVEAAAFTDARNLVLGVSRRLCISKRGFLGYFPESAKPGDQIWAVKGCHVPLVLRSLDRGGAELVGDCYIQGLMHGEMMSQTYQTEIREIELV